MLHVRVPRQQDASWRHKPLVWRCKLTDRSWLAQTSARTDEVRQGGIVGNLEPCSSSPAPHSTKLLHLTHVEHQQPSVLRAGAVVWVSPPLVHQLQPVDALAVLAHWIQSGHLL